MSRFREFIKILLLCIGAAIAYGMVHDQITVRICIEYFTVAHPPVFNTDSPTLLGLGWGVLATWWVGAFLGVLLAVAALVGSWPTLPASKLRRPIGLLLASMAVGAIISGLSGYFLTKQGMAGIGGWESAIPESRQNAFAADLWAHSTSYLFGFVGGLGLAIHTLWLRRRRSRLSVESIAPNPMPSSE